jgi:hypothetical protein
VHELIQPRPRPLRLHNEYGVVTHTDILTVNVQDAG